MSKIKKTYGNTKSLTEIVVKGARQHNLKNINVTIPRDKLVVITGLSAHSVNAEFIMYPAVAKQTVTVITYIKNQS